MVPSVGNLPVAADRASLRLAAPTITVTHLPYPLGLSDYPPAILRVLLQYFR